MTEFIELDPTPETSAHPWLSSLTEPISTQQGDQAHILFSRGGELILARATWGLVQHWRAYGNAPHYSVAGETIARQWTLSEAFRNRRCVIPATSFSYLREVDGATLRYRLRPARGGFLLLGGIHEPNVPQLGGSSPTMAVITTTPNSKLAPYGLPVPLLLTRRQAWQWLQADTDIGEIRGLVRPCSRSHLALEIAVESPGELASSEREFALA